MIPRILLKSCATPLASVPMGDSSFCALLTCSINRVRSVMSLIIPEYRSPSVTQLSRVTSLLLLVLSNSVSKFCTARAVRTLLTNWLAVFGEQIIR